MEGKVGQNLILIRPDKEFRTYQVNGIDTGISTATDGESGGQRMSVRGTVVKLPSRLVYNGDKIAKERKNFANNRSSINIIQRLIFSSVQYDTKVEVAVGDIVFFNYLEHYQCYQDGRWIEHEGEDLLLMKYDALYCSHKLNNLSSLKPLNGYVLIQPYRPKEVVTKFEVQKLEKLKNKVDKIGYGVVTLTGKKCTGYLEDSSAPADGNEVQKGQKIIFKPKGARTLEWGLHQVLFKGLTIQAIHRKDILMIL